MKGKQMPKYAEERRESTKKLERLVWNYRRKYVERKSKRDAISGLLESGKITQFSERFRDLQAAVDAIGAQMAVIDRQYMAERERLRKSGQVDLSRFPMSLG